MQRYKIYSINSEGHISVLAERFECAKEQEALIKLAQAANGNAAELWSGKRLIARFPSDDEAN
jgi:hypothetical protein